MHVMQWHVYMYHGHHETPMRYMMYIVLHTYPWCNGQNVTLMLFGHHHTHTPTHVQTVQFFGFTLLACYVFFLMLGTVGFYSSLHFVRYIYKNLKLD